MRADERADQSGDGAGRTMTRAMRSTVGRESTTFGFSILVTVTFGLLQAQQGTPGTAESFIYAAGAVLSFTLLEGILSRGFRGTMPQHRTEVLALGTSMNLVSVLVGMGAGWVVAVAMTGLPAWFVAPLVASIVYLIGESVGTAVAEKVHHDRGDSEARQTSA